MIDINKKIIIILNVSICFLPLFLKCLSNPSTYSHTIMLESNSESEIDTADKLPETKNDVLEEEIEDVIEENPEEITFTEHNMPDTSGFKSYMSYKALTQIGSRQLKLQESAYTGRFGIRQYDDRFCVAIGTAYNAKVGTYVDLVLDNGVVIECIIGDLKATVHTDKTNRISANGCVSEFIVDMNQFHSTAKTMGDTSYCSEDWMSPVRKIIVYEYNIFYN